MHLSLNVIAIVYALLVTGCASLSEDQCRMGRWRSIGEADGAAGMPLDRFIAHREACAEYGIRPNEAEYLAGHDLGLRYYCVPQSALKEGLSGRSYQGVCPGRIGHRFAEIHGAAYLVYRAREKVTSIDDDIHKTELEIRSEKTSAERKKILEEDLLHLERKLRRARNELGSQEIMLDLTTRMITP